MKNKEILWGIIKRLIAMTAAASVIGTILNFIPNEDLSINLCRGVIILESAAGIFVVLSFMSSKQNYKSAAIAVGYCTISVLSVLSLFHSSPIVKQSFNKSGQLMQLFNDVLEVIYIMAALKWVKINTSMKKYSCICAGILILGITLGYRFNLKSLLSQNERQTEVVSIFVHTILLIGLVIFLRRYYFEKDEFYQTNRFRILLILMSYVLYELSAVVFQMKFNVQREIFLALLKSVIYMHILSLIYHDTYNCLQKADEVLNHKIKKLTSDTAQKNRLISVSQRLQADVDTIICIAQRLNDGMQHPKYSKKLKFLTMIKKNGNRLKKLALNIGAMNALDNGEVLPNFTLVDIAAFLNQIIESVEPYTHAMETRIQFVQSKAKICCRIDTDLIERIMLNLISNAIKYNKEQGLVTVYVNTRRNDVYICIQDNGLGISADKLNTIFNKYERGDKETAGRREGSGLGLSIVKSLIEMHKGSICLVSKEHYGTTVSIRLPKHEGEIHEISQNHFVNKERLIDKVKIEFADLGV